MLYACIIILIYDANVCLFPIVSFGGVCALFHFNQIKLACMSNKNGKQKTNAEIKRIIQTLNKSARELSRINSSVKTGQSKLQKIQRKANSN